MNRIVVKMAHAEGLTSRDSERLSDYADKERTCKNVLCFWWVRKNED